MPLLPGTPTSSSQSPEVSYNPAVVITARVKWQTAAPSTLHLALRGRPLRLGLAPGGVPGESPRFTRFG
jgi:hypothetical protein